MAFIRNSIQNDLMCLLFNKLQIKDIIKKKVRFVWLIMNLKK